MGSSHDLLSAANDLSAAHTLSAAYDLSGTNVLSATNVLYATNVVSYHWLWLPGVLLLIWWLWWNCVSQFAKTVGREEWRVMGANSSFQYSLFWVPNPLQKFLRIAH